MIKAYFAETAGVDESLVVATFTLVGGRRQMRQLSEARTVIDATIFVEDSKHADAAASSFPGSTSELESVYAFNGMTVLSYDVKKSETSTELDNSPVVTTGILLFVAALLLCFN